MAIGDAMIGRLWALDPAREEDWDALYADQLPRVLNFLRYRIGNAAVAEDLTSHTFEKAWVARHRYRRDLAKFSTWLLVIARNVANDYFRRQRDMVPLEAAESVATSQTPEAVAERRADGEQLAVLLARLPERERELVALKYGSELNNRQIARITGLSESNVGTILHRTIQVLRTGWTE